MPAPDEKDIFSRTLSFEDLGLGEKVLKGLAAAGYTRPTDIQARLIPPIIAGTDVLGQAKTGTGKTAAFGLPLLHLADAKTPVSSLILVPTRELAIQVAKEIQALGKFTGIRTLPIYGGQRIQIQADGLKKNPQIIVGTPGRIMDMHGRGYLRYDNLRYAVLDEVDRMLDIGFRDDIRKILGGIKGEHQTIFVSATISGEIESLARRYMNNPEKISTSSGSLTVTQVDQSHLAVAPWDKRRLLVHLLTHEDPALTLVFCATKDTVNRLTDYLNRKSIDAHAIHGDMYQGKRNRVMTKFREGKLSVLIASDLAARGLDVVGISHVINYDVPVDPDNYVHRIGRTARIGEKGIAWTFITPDDGDSLTAIEQLINQEVPLKEYDDFKPGEIPDRIRRERTQAKQEQDSVRERKNRHRVTALPPQKTADPDLFPGGLVPTGVPKRRMQGRSRPRRGR